jgi:hypothetical protein
LENFFLKIGVFSDKSTFSQKFQKFFFYFGGIFFYDGILPKQKSQKIKKIQKKISIAALSPLHRSRKGGILRGDTGGGVS